MQSSGFFRDVELRRRDGRAGGRGAGVPVDPQLDITGNKASKKEDLENRCATSAWLSGKPSTARRPRTRSTSSTSTTARALRRARRSSIEVAGNPWT